MRGKIRRIQRTPLAWTGISIDVDPPDRVTPLERLG
jgi:hypothetical protein